MYYLLMLCLSLSPLSIVSECVLTSIMDWSGLKRWYWRLIGITSLFVVMFSWSLVSVSSVSHCDCES